MRPDAPAVPDRARRRAARRRARSGRVSRRPLVVERYVNRQLADMGEYRGSVSEVDLFLWRGGYALRNLRDREGRGVGGVARHAVRRDAADGSDDGMARAVPRRGRRRGRDVLARAEPRAVRERRGHAARRAASAGRRRSAISSRSSSTSCEVRERPRDVSRARHLHRGIAHDARLPARAPQPHERERRGQGRVRRHRARGANHGQRAVQARRPARSQRGGRRRSTSTSRSRTRSSST